MDPWGIWSLSRQLTPADSSGSCSPNDRAAVKASEPRPPSEAPVLEAKGVPGSERPAQQLLGERRLRVRLIPLFLLSLPLTVRCSLTSQNHRKADGGSIITPAVQTGEWAQGINNPPWSQGQQWWGRTGRRGAWLQTPHVSSLCCKPMDCVLLPFPACLFAWFPRYPQLTPHPCTSEAKSNSLAWSG